MGSNEHGGAQFDNEKGTPEDIALNGLNFLIGRSVGGMQYGYYSSKITIDEKHFVAAPAQRHLISVAPTRSGKGVSLIIPNLLLYRGSAIVIDPKGENAWITAKYRREGMGQQTFILDPWGEINRRYGDKAGELETVARFNPLSILNPASENYADDVAYLADALIINQGKDPHWDDSARELVAGLMAYLVEHPEYQGKATFKMLRILLSKPVAEIRVIAEEAQKLGFDSLAARKLGRFAIDSKETASIISTALTQTAFLDSVTLAANMKESDFSFEDLINGQATIYLVLPVDKLQTYGRWLRLMVSIGIRTVARNVKPLPLPVLFMLDEFGTIGRLNAVAQAYGLMAGLQIMIWAFVQDLNQLKRDYPDDWETFIGNSYGLSGFSVMDQFTAEYISRMLGNTTLEEISKQTAKIRESGEHIFASPDPNYMSMNDRSFGRALMQPSEVRGIRNDFGIFQVRGLPKIFQRAAYYNEPFFLERARVDPNFPSMAQAKKNIAIIKEIPNYEAAVAYMKKLGFDVKEKGFFSSKIKVFDASGKEYAFETDEALIQWARQDLAKK